MIIQIIGLPGSGKTTLSVAHERGWNYIQWGRV
jgi:broad-specificity NMP kinase